MSGKSYNQLRNNDAKNVELQNLNNITQKRPIKLKGEASYGKSYLQNEQAMIDCKVGINNSINSSSYHNMNDSPQSPLSN